MFWSRNYYNQNERQTSCHCHQYTWSLEIDITTSSASAITQQFQSMAEITPLLDDIDDSYPHNGEFEGEAHVPTTAYFKRLVKILIIITLILSTFTIALLIANYIIVCISLSRYRWDVRDSSVGLGIVVRIPANSSTLGLPVPACTNSKI